MKRFKKIMAILMVTALILSIAAISANAATTVVGPSAVNFTKYLVVDENTNIPNGTINFNIVSGTAVPADASHVAVLAGPAGATVGTVTFAPGNTTYTDVQTGDDLTLATGKKYAKQTGVIDLSGVTFTEPGVYRYELTETTSDISGLGQDARTLYLDVYVTSDASANLTVSSTVLHTDATAPARNSDSGSADVATANAAVSDKVTGFTNTYPTKELEFSKAVSGNQASRDKYFAFTVTIENATTGDVYAVDLTNADSSITANPNAATTAINAAVNQPATLTVGQGGSVSQVYYLHHGQSIKVQGLPYNATYTVVEAEEDYTPAVAVTGDVDNQSANEATITANHQASGTIDADDADTITAAFTNTKDGVIPTGVLVTIAPFAIGILLFGALIIFFIAKRKRNNY